MLSKKASLYAAFGCTLGIIPHLLATIMGLAALLHSSALAFQMLKWLGAIYLLYIAWSTWKNKTAFQINTQVESLNTMSIINKAILLNVLNPKLTIFFLAFLPQFIPANSTQALAHMLLLSSTFMLMTLIVFIFYGLVAHAFRHYVIQSKRVQTYMRYGFTATFVGLSSKLAFSEK